jgi:hypothetical protein
MSVGPHVTATTAINKFRYGLNLVLMDPRTSPGYFARKYIFKRMFKLLKNIFTDLSRSIVLSIEEQKFQK